MTRTVGVVVPAFRPEPDVLAGYVGELEDRLAPERIRIELDEPEPGTLRTLEDCPATVATAVDRRGKGAAITAGFEALGTDVLAFVDADGSTPAASVADVVARVRTGRASLSVGSRRHPDAAVDDHQTFVRRRLGDAFAWTARRLLPVSLYDYQCGAKAIRREAWADVRTHLREPGFAWDVELVALADALGHRIVEVPVSWEDAERSTVSPVGTTVELGVALVRSRHRAASLRGDRVHAAIARRRGQPQSVLDRLGREPGDE